eukprot:RCo033075
MCALFGITEFMTTTAPIEDLEFRAEPSDFVVTEVGLDGTEACVKDTTTIPSVVLGWCPIASHSRPVEGDMESSCSSRETSGSEFGGDDDRSEDGGRDSASALRLAGRGPRFSPEERAAVITENLDELLPSQTIAKLQEFALKTLSATEEELKNVSLCLGAEDKPRRTALFRAVKRRWAHLTTTVRRNGGCSSAELTSLQATSSTPEFHVCPDLKFFKLREVLPEHADLSAVV